MDSVRLGVPWERAALTAGVSVSALSDWRKRGADLLNDFDTIGEFKDDMSELDWACVKLAEDLDIATEETIHDMVEMITVQARVDWRAAAWWLERRDAVHFGRSTKPDKADEAPVLGGMGVQVYVPDNGRGPK